MLSLDGADERLLCESVGVHLLGDPAVPQDDDARAHGEQVALVGGGDDDREAVGGEAGDQLVDRDAGADVDARGRLAEQQDPGVAAQAARHDHLLLIAAAERRDRRVAAAR